MADVLPSQGLGFTADLPAPFVVGRTPFADVLDMTETPGTDPALVEPTHADARRRHRRADVTVKRLGWPRLVAHSDLVEVQLLAGSLPDDTLEHLAQQLFALLADPLAALFVVVEVESPERSASQSWRSGSWRLKISWLPLSNLMVSTPAEFSMSTSRPLSSNKSSGPVGSRRPDRGNALRSNSLQVPRNWLLTASRARYGRLAGNAKHQAISFAL